MLTVERLSGVFCYLYYACMLTVDRWLDTEDVFCQNLMVVLSLQKVLQCLKTVAMPAVAMYDILSAGCGDCQAWPCLTSNFQTNIGPNPIFDLYSLLMHKSEYCRPHDVLARAPAWHNTLLTVSDEHFHWICVARCWLAVDCVGHQGRWECWAHRQMRTIFWLFSVRSCHSACDNFWNCISFSNPPDW